MEAASTRIVAPDQDESNTLATEERDEQNELECQLRRLRDMVDNGRVDEARVLIQEMEQRWPESGPVQHFVRVLAPPRLLSRRPATGRPRDQEYAWLRQHAREYPGQWLALVGNRLIAADRELARVLEVLRQTPEGNQALLHHQMGDID